MWRKFGKKSTKMLVAVVLLVGVAVTTFVAMGVNNEEPTNKVGLAVPNGDAGNKNDEVSGSADDLKAEPMGVSEATEGDDNVVEVNSGDSGQSIMSWMRSNEANNVRSASMQSYETASNGEVGNNVDVNDSSNLSNEVEDATKANEEAARMKAEENARRAAEEEASRAEMEARMAGGAGIYYGSDANTYPWKNDCPDRQDSYVTYYNGYRIGGNVCECVSYAAWKVYERYGIAVNWGDARQWANVAQRNSYMVKNTPAVNTVGVIENGGYYGHVFWVESMNADGSITISEYNIPYSTGLYSGDAHMGDYGVRTVPANSVSYYKYIYFE